MELNTDFSKRVVVHSEDIAWQASPMKGVERRMLDRIGEEVARATTIVRFAPGSKFSAHTHDGGEEFIVLDGVFQDEHGDFPKGTYVRNPPTTSHTPGSEEGCTIFVKLWQFDADDRGQFRKDIDAELGDEVNGVAKAELHRDAREVVTYFAAEPGSKMSHSASGGIEVLILQGDLQENNEILQVGSWLRLPEGADFNATVGKKGAKVWMKTGYLNFTEAPKS